MRLAHHFSAEIISVDSMQVYRGMDIGTAKPTILERGGVAHHMLDVVEPEEEFSVAEFRRLGRKVIEESEAETLIITGGSGLHFRALVDPLEFAPTDADLRARLENEGFEGLLAELVSADPEARIHVDLANPRRVVRAVEIYRLTGQTPSQRAAAGAANQVRRYVPEVAFVAAGVDPGSNLDERIDERVAEMRSGGLVEEVSSLRGRLGRTARAAVGYREITDALEKGSSVDAAITQVARNTKKLARKQRTWFQRDPRIRWIPWTDDVAGRVSRLIEVFG